MKCVVGIDLGSTTTKAILLDVEDGRILGQGITNSRSNYEVASAVAREEALTAARFRLLSDALHAGVAQEEADRLQERLLLGFRHEVFLTTLSALAGSLQATIVAVVPEARRAEYHRAAELVIEAGAKFAEGVFIPGAARKSDFFKDLAAEAMTTAAAGICEQTGAKYERLLGVFDRAILDVERQIVAFDFDAAIQKAARRSLASLDEAARTRAEGHLLRAVELTTSTEIDEVAFVGTGYGRQTLPFPKEAVRSEILCHGRGAHKFFPGTRTVLDIGGQDTKAIQVDDHGVVTSFQMNDRCAAGCGRYLGYIADELNLGLHELGPLALGAKRVVKVNSTCTVFAGAELRERLSVGERREDILAGLHRAIMLRAMSLLARSGGVRNQLTFTGGVGKNPMATKVLRELVTESYSAEIELNLHPDSIYMGALGAALFALDDFRAGRAIVPTALRALYAQAESACCGEGCEGCDCDDKAGAKAGEKCGDGKCDEGAGCHA